MNTYGYIREATMARLDIDESEAQAMNLLSRFHIYANEAMQAICASKPMYKYIEVTVVKELPPIVLDGGSFRLATETEINWNEETMGTRPDGILPLMNEERTKEYWHEKNTYLVGEKVKPTSDFIAFANKRCYKRIKLPFNPEQALELEVNPYKLIKTEEITTAIVDDDFSYVGANELKFYKPGEYKIPAKFLWHIFVSAESYDEVLDMPADILACIPIYISAVCYQIDNLQKAQIVKQEFELALSRCTSTDFMKNAEVTSSW